MLDYILCFGIYHYPIIACCPAKVATIDLSHIFVQPTVFPVHEGIKISFLYSNTQDDRQLQCHL